MRRPSPALAVSLIALFVALGGTGYAAVKVPKSSVGATQLKKNAVTSAKVKNGSLLVGDFKSAERRKLRGPAGAAGAAGAGAARPGRRASRGSRATRVWRRSWCGPRRSRSRSRTA